MLRRTVGVAAVAGVFGAEGLGAALVPHYAVQTTVCVAVLVLLPLLLARSLRGRALALSTAVVFSFVAYFTVYAHLMA
jgi:hypothetical protein